MIGGILSATLLFPERAGAAQAPPGVPSLQDWSAGTPMAAEGAERKLAAVMFTDVVGYTALMAESEEKGLAVRERHRELVRPLVERYHGTSIEARGTEATP